MQEFFDVLNEKGQYINQIETRETCHTKGLWHKAVAVFIINSKKQVLLQKRSPYKKLWPNYWDITAGGHVLAGEFGFQAIIREIKEETNLDIKKVTSYIDQFDYLSGSSKKCRQFNFKVEVTGGPILLTEHDSYKWISLNEIETEKNISPEVKHGLLVYKFNEEQKMSRG